MTGDAALCRPETSALAEPFGGGVRISVRRRGLHSKEAGAVACLLDAFPG